MNKRKFRVTIGITSIWVYPVNDDELIYKWEKVSAINFVKKLTTKLIFRNDSKTGVTDFDTFYNLEKDISTRCNEIICEIFKVCGGAEVLEYTGIIPLKSGIWNLERCTVQLALEPQNNIYDCIKDIKKDVRIPISENCPFAAGLPGIDPVVPGFFLYDKIGPDFVFITKNQFTVGGLAYVPKSWPLGGGDEVRYPYGMFAVLCYNVVSRMLATCNADYDCNVPVLKSDFFDWNAPGDTIGYVPSTTPKLPMTMPRENYPGGVAGGGADGPGYCNRWIFNPITPGINYVTGQPNLLTNMTYMPKSNANNNTASEWEEPMTADFEPSGNFVTFEDIERIWATMFDAHWFIDTDGCMRIEHISWFNNTGITYDTTLAPHATLNEANRNYSYKDELLPRKEIFLFSTNRDKLNGRVAYYANKNNEILYDKICVSHNKENEEKTYALPLVTTDIKAIDSRNNTVETEFYNNDGFMLFTTQFGVPYLQHNVGGNYEGAYSVTNSTSEVLLNSVDATLYENGHLQWANLIRRYLKYGRVLPTGENGSETITFNTRTLKTKEQVPVFLKYCCDDGDFSPNQAQIITSLGTGEILEAEYSTKNQTIKIKTLHD